MAEPAPDVEPNRSDTDRPPHRPRPVLFALMALTLYGLMAMFGLGALGKVLDQVPGGGFVAGFFGGVSLFSLPVAWVRARGSDWPRWANPWAPRLLIAFMWVALTATALAGVIAIAMDIGFLEVVVKR